VRLDFGGNRHLICSLALVNNLLGSAVGLQQVFRTAQFGLGKYLLGHGLVPRRQAGFKLGNPLGHVVHGQLEVIVGRASAGYDCAALGFSLLDLRLGNGNRRCCAVYIDLVPLGTKLDDELALVHELVVININLEDRARNSWRDVGYVPGHVGIASADRMQCQNNLWPEPKPPTNHASR
jgi:hypothetical protein